MEISDIDSFTTDAATVDWYLGQVVQALVDGNDTYTASLLLDCKMVWQVTEEFAETVRFNVTLLASYGTCERLNAYHPSATEQRETYSSGIVTVRRIPLEIVERVLRDILPSGVCAMFFKTKLATVPLQINWREELLETIRRSGTTNQGVDIVQSDSRTLTYANLRFRSQSEIRIAQALDRARVMYLPNCSARVNHSGDRVKREPDFLICHEGRWGVLEVDGEPFHPASRTVADHERDRLFKAHGIVHVEHYDANRCYQEPDQVVSGFLALLKTIM